MVAIVMCPQHACNSQLSHHKITTAMSQGCWARPQLMSCPSSGNGLLHPTLPRTHPLSRVPALECSQAAATSQFPFPPPCRLALAHAPVHASAAAAVRLWASPQDTAQRQRAHRRVADLVTCTASARQARASAASRGSAFAGRARSTGQRSHDKGAIN